MWGTLMADVILPGLYSPISETIAALDGLRNAERQRDREWFQRLEAAVARLDGPPVPDLEGGSELQGRSDVRSERSVGSSKPDPAPYVALPRRRTHGGDFGPKVRAKLTAEALGKRGWR